MLACKKRNISVSPKPEKQQLVQRSVRRHWQVLHLFFGDLKTDITSEWHLSKSFEFFWVIDSEMLKYSFKTNY